jgi:hypothetical protein
MNDIVMRNGYIERVSIHEAKANIARLNHALGHSEGQRRQDLLLCLYGWQETLNGLLNPEIPAKRRA